MGILQRRIGVLFALFLGLLALGGLRALYLGTVRSGALEQAAQTEHQTVEELPAPRGTVTDRGGVVLAVSEPADEISADPYLIKDPLATAQKLAPLLGESSSAVLTKLSEHTGYVPLAQALPAKRAEQVAQLTLGGEPIAGLEEKPVMRRVYPRGTLAAQVLGGVNAQGNGFAGIEYSENKVLRGVSGQRTVISDARGQPISITNDRQERPGASVSLTIDAAIQHRAEQVLGAVGKDFSPKTASAIVMDPRTGAVLAMANWPQVNANDVAQALSESPTALENHAVSFDYEPGSTFKIVTFSGSVQDGVITPESIFSVPDKIELGGRIIHDDAPHPLEALSASQILARSSNVGTIKIALRLGPERFNGWLHKFGFGKPTGIELPGEESGAVLSPSEYSGSSMGNLPIGQGEMVTPIQLATAYSAVADGGVMRRPHIVSAIGGRPVALPAGHRIISEATAARMRTMFEGVVGPEGTANGVSIPGYQLAGKTGSAERINPGTHEYSQTLFNASFVGFAPAAHPKLVCVVVVDQPQKGSVFGGTVAAPAVAQILAFSLPFLGIAPE